MFPFLRIMCMYRCIYTRIYAWLGYVLMCTYVQHMSPWLFHHIFLLSETSEHGSSIMPFNSSFPFFNFPFFLTFAPNHDPTRPDEKRAVENLKPYRSYININTYMWPVKNIVDVCVCVCVKPYTSLPSFERSAFRNLHTRPHLNLWFNFSFNLICLPNYNYGASRASSKGGIISIKDIRYSDDTRHSFSHSLHIPTDVHWLGWSGISSLLRKVSYSSFMNWNNSYCDDFTHVCWTGEVRSLMTTSGLLKRKQRKLPLHLEGEWWRIWGLIW